MLLLKLEGNESCINQTVCHVCKNNFFGDDTNNDYQNHTKSAMQDTKHQKTFWGCLIMIPIMTKIL